MRALAFHDGVEPPGATVEPSQLSAAPTVDDPKR